MIPFFAGAGIAEYSHALLHILDSKFGNRNIKEEQRTCAIRGKLCLLPA